MTTPFDKRAVFQKELLPLVEELEKKCAQAQVPFFFTAAVYNDQENTEYESRAKTAVPMELKLSNDLLVNHMKVAAGFECVLPESMPDIEL